MEIKCTKENICLFGLAVAGLVSGAYVLAKDQYHKGRIDANTEHIKTLENMREEVLNMMNNEDRAE